MFYSNYFINLIDLLNFLVFKNLIHDVLRKKKKKFPQLMHIFLIFLRFLHLHFSLYERVAKDRNATCTGSTMRAYFS